jgi:alkylmercury lyase
MDEKSFEKVSAAVLALFPPLGATEQRIAMALYRLLALGKPVATAALADAVHIPPDEIERTLNGWPDVRRDRVGDIVGYAGLTVLETRHRLRVNGAELYAWCAWDTLFLPPLLGVTAKVESTCAATGEDVTLTVHPERFESATRRPLVSLVAPDPQAAHADIEQHFCCHVQFFAVPVATRPGTHLATLEQAWRLGQRRNARRFPVSQA